MASTILKSVTVGPHDLALYNAINGILADAYKVEIEILDASTAFPGTVLVAKTDVTTAAKVSTGIYRAVDAGGSPWIPAATCKRGRCIWSITQAAGDEPAEVERSFEVVEASVARRSSLGLALIEDIYDAGMDESTYPREVVHATLGRWRDLIERVCRQRFRPVFESKRIRGQKAIDVLPLSEPLFALSTIMLNGDTVTSDNANFFVFGGRLGEQRNPRIELASNPSFYAPSNIAAGFAHGMIQTVAGAWGFVDPDTYDPPEEIRRAAIRGTVLALTSGIAGSSSSGSPGGPIKSETTDGHSVEYGVTTSTVRTGLLSLIGDAAIRDALMLYRGPIGIAVTFGG
jgi:hypothetical protein